MCTRTFSVPRKQMFQIYLLRTHPRDSSTDWSPYLSQSLRYPFGRDYSVTPISLRRERKLNELLPRHQQFDRAVFQAQSRKMSYHPCPDEALSRNDARQQSVGDGGVFKPPTQILQRTKNCQGRLALYSYPNLLSQPCLTWTLSATISDSIPRRESKVYHASTTLSTLNFSLSSLIFSRQAL